MKIVLLSGGSGQNLWPLSNNVRSKQFIKIFRDEKGNEESLLQRIHRQIRHYYSDMDCTIATANAQVSTILNQLNTDLHISIEPERKDTFYAILLACEYLVGLNEIKQDETIIVCPTDLYVENEFFSLFAQLDARVQEGRKAYQLIGVQPDEVSTRYGYIKDNHFYNQVTKEEAKKLIEEGALWNSGVVAFCLKDFLAQAKEIISYEDYLDLYAKYEELEPLSFDEAILKKSKIEALPYEGKWKDIGTWQTFTKEMQGNIIGQGLLGEDCKNVHIINELDLPILCTGVEDIIVSASSQGVLVTSEEASESIKPYIAEINPRVMYSEKSWGAFHIIDVNEESLTIKVTMATSLHK